MFWEMFDRRFRLGQSVQRPWTVSSRPPLGAHDVAEALQGLVGDDAEDALEVLYTHHASLVFNVALRVTRSRAAAEEVTQAVFLELWHRPDQFDPARSSLRSWLATVSHSRSTEWVRPGTADDGASGGRGTGAAAGGQEADREGRQEELAHRRHLFLGLLPP